MRCNYHLGERGLGGGGGAMESGHGALRASYPGSEIQSRTRVRHAEARELAMLGLGCADWAEDK